jgi:hypothetical protein
LFLDRTDDFFGVWWNDLGQINPWEHAPKCISAANFIAMTTRDDSKIPRQWSLRIHARAWTTVTLQFFFLGPVFSMFRHVSPQWSHAKYSEFLWWSWSVGFTCPLESGCWCFPCRLRQLRKDIEVEYLRTLNARGPSTRCWPGGSWLQPATWMRHTRYTRYTMVYQLQDRWGRSFRNEMLLD